MDEDDELLAALGVDATPKAKASRSPVEARVVAGFEEIVKFVDDHGRPPAHGENRDIFERLYAIRLDRIRAQPTFHPWLLALDKHGLLDAASIVQTAAETDFDDDALLAKLGVDDAEDDLSTLKHVKPRAEIRAAEEIANRVRCEDFAKYKPLFDQVQKDLDSGVRESRRFKRDAQINEGEFFILGGQVAYVSSLGEVLEEYDRTNRRVRLIFDNGTQSDMLLRSLQRALYKDDVGRRITDPSAGPLFGNAAEEGDTETGTIYVLRSKSSNSYVAAHRDVIHKIGVTGGDVDVRVSNAKVDATFLLADVEVVATYKLFHINRTKLENTLHRFLSPARLDLEILDRFGHPVKPREWFVVPLPVIDQIVEKLRDRSITDFAYDPHLAALVSRA